MKPNIIKILSALILSCTTLIGCSTAQNDIPDDASLVIMGNVNQVIGWLESDIRVMETVDVKATNNSGQVETYTGVPLRFLLDTAGVKPEAISVQIQTADGLSADAPLSDVMSCEDCILTFRNKGGFSIVAPGLGKDFQLKGVVKIQVK